MQVCLPVDWAIEKSLETQIPHEVFDILLREKVLFEIDGEIINQRLEISQLWVSLKALPKGAMKHTEVHIVGINDLVKKFGVFFLKNAAGQALVCDGQALIFIFGSINGLRMLNDDV